MASHSQTARRPTAKRDPILTDAPPAEQVFNLRSAVPLYGIFTAEHGVVNLDGD
jgi:hypothetical protein